MQRARLRPVPQSVPKPLRRLGVARRQVTDAIFSHHDRTLDAARFHAPWAIDQDHRRASRKVEGFQVSPQVRLLETAGHTPQEITTAAVGREGAVAFTHLRPDPDGPAEDPYAPRSSRDRVPGGEMSRSMADASSWFRGQGRIPRRSFGAARP